ncbi:MAG: hypothetical protein HS115_11660 [Spirochaetales bacterium]|nr:hypothetical protein [Spirochaetales bacterium]
MDQNLGNMTDFRQCFEQAIRLFPSNSILSMYVIGEMASAPNDRFNSKEEIFRYYFSHPLSAEPPLNFWAWRDGCYYLGLHTFTEPQKFTVNVFRNETCEIILGPLQAQTTLERINGVGMDYLFFILQELAFRIATETAEEDEINFARKILGTEAFQEFLSRSTVKPATIRDYSGFLPVAL